MPRRTQRYALVFEVICLIAVTMNDQEVHVSVAQRLIISAADGSIPVTPQVVGVFESSRNTSVSYTHLLRGRTADFSAICIKALK